MTDILDLIRSVIQDNVSLAEQLLDSFEASLGDLAEGEEGGRQISMKRHVLTVGTVDGRFVH